MNFSHSGHILISGGEDNKVKIWDMNGKKESLTIECHESLVRATIISPDDEFCTSLGDDCKIVRWKIPGFDRQLSLESDNSIVSKM